MIWVGFDGTSDDKASCSSSCPEDAQITGNERLFIVL